MNRYVSYSVGIKGQKFCFDDKMEHLIPCYKLVFEVDFCHQTNPLSPQISNKLTHPNTGFVFLVFLSFFSVSEFFVTDCAAATAHINGPSRTLAGPSKPDKLLFRYCLGHS